MAKKQNNTRELQYNDIATKHGLLLKQCLIGFKFNSDSDSAAFHFRLMEEHVDYAMFDGATENVKVIADVSLHYMITEIAREIGGEPYTPTPLNNFN